jgi:hypothetical protein
MYCMKKSKKRVIVFIVTLMLLLTMLPFAQLPPQPPLNKASWINPIILL